MTETVLIAGVSVRSLAESATRAGYAVVAVDAFADLDLRAIASEVHLVASYTADAAARAARGVRAAAVCYVSNFENHPEALRELARHRRLWGNAADTLARARDPATLVGVLAAAGLPAPRVRRRAPVRGSGSASVRWLLKPRASGGGHGVTPWSAGRPVQRSWVLQERMPGRPGSVIFAADGEHAVVLGVTRQLIGERRFGASGFRYCGTLIAPPTDPEWGMHSPIAERGTELAAVLTDAFGLVGVNGIDVMVHRGRVVPIEINPRPTAAAELLERRDGLSIFRAHIAGSTGRLRAFTIPPPAGQAVGKAIVFAREAVTMPAAHHWLANSDMRDVPSPGSHIPAGAPICTVFASAPTSRECYMRLVMQADRLYEELRPRRGRERSDAARRKK